MTYQVTSDRLEFDRGDIVDADVLAGCNIDALVQGGHLAAVQEHPKTKRLPVGPVPDDTANEPEEL